MIMNRKYVLRWSALAIVVVLLLLGGAFGLPLLRSVSSTSEPVLVYLDQDDNFDSLAVKLKATGKAEMNRGLRLAARLLKYQDRVRPGCYDVGSGQSAWTVVWQLRAGHQQPIRLTIPQVWTKEQLAARLSRQLMTDSASLASLFNDSTALRAYDTSPEMLVSLFVADTYEVYWTLTPEALLKRMAKEQKAFWTDERLAQAKQQGLTPDEVAILASIVDKETTNVDEMPMVAGMYLNRLRTNMLLQADPTVKFALGNFALRRMLNVHLAYDSPYNTYKYAGLPPGPICVPSQQAIKAVLRPAEHNYLYMCAKEDFSNAHNFATTYAEHLANARRYQQALNQRGIK